METLTILCPPGGRRHSSTAVGPARLPAGRGERTLATGRGPREARALPADPHPCALRSEGAA